MNFDTWALKTTMQLKGKSPQLTKRISPYIDKITIGDFNSLEEMLLNDINEILNKYNDKPIKGSEYNKEDYLFCLFFLVEIDTIISYLPSLAIRKDPKLPNNGIFLSFFRSGHFIDSLLLAMINFLSVHEPYYYERDEILTAISEYQKGLDTNLFDKSPSYKEL